MDRWWANCIRNEAERTAIGALIQRVRQASEGYVFRRAMYEKLLDDRLETGRLGVASSDGE
jgi:hypothetical protein